MSEQMCNCGCGKTIRRAAIEAMHAGSLNYDQAEAMVQRANRARATGGDTHPEKEASDV